MNENVDLPPTYLSLVGVLVFQSYVWYVEYIIVLSQLAHHHHRWTNERIAIRSRELRWVGVRKWIMHPVQPLTISLRDQETISAFISSFFCTVETRERIFTMISKINGPFVRFKQGFLPVGRHRRKHPFSLRYIESRTLDARFDLFGILAIFLGHWTLIARQNPPMQPKGRRHACVMEPSSTYCAEHGCKNLFGYC